MLNNTNNNQDETSPHIEKLLAAANSASETVAALHVGFLAFFAYLGVIVWSTSDDDLLRISPVKLPILDVELPLTAFYACVPWMLVLLHFNLLMQLELLSCKLWNLDRDLPDTEAGQQVRDRLFIFPFTHLIVGRSGGHLIRWLLSAVVGLTVIALPLLMLLAAQIRFLPFHDEAITWSQRLAVWMDAALLLTLWPLIASPQDQARIWWRDAFLLIFTYWPSKLKYYLSLGVNALKPSNQRQSILLPRILQDKTDPKGVIFLLISVPVIVFLSLVAVIPGNTTVQSYFAAQQHMTNQDAPEQSGNLEDWLIRHVPSSWLSVVVHRYDQISCTSLDLAEKKDASLLQVILGSCTWFNLHLFSRNLELAEARLVPKEMSLSLLTKAIDNNKIVRDAAFKEFDGLNLQNRDLRFANLLGAVLPKADLRHVQLQGAVLLKAKLQGVRGWDKTQLQGAILGGTQLQNAGLLEADLQGADLRGANLQGAELGWAKLQGADLRGADLQGANLQGAKLQGADLRGANFQGANLHQASLAGANMAYTNLQGANLSAADLSAVVLHEANFYAVDWSGANLDASFLTQAPSSIKATDKQSQLENSLKNLLSFDQYTSLVNRISLSGNSLPSGQPLSQVGCYSENTELLACDYRYLLQLDAYLNEVLYPKLIALACTDSVIAMSIAKRGMEQTPSNYPHYGLASALIAAMASKHPCPELSALSEETWQKLQTSAKAKPTTMPH